MKNIFRNLHSTLAIGIVSLFVLFLTVSAPHRVHHLFENLREPNHHGHHVHKSMRPRATSAVDDHTHGHAHSAGPLHAGTTHHDQNHDDNPQTVCLLESASQHSHLSIVHLAKIPFLSTESGERSGGLFLRLPPFNPSPSSQRAPPEA